MHAWHKSVDQDLVQHCYLHFTAPVHASHKGTVNVIVMVFFLCVQFHSYNKETNTEVTEEYCFNMFVISFYVGFDSQRRRVK